MFKVLSFQRLPKTDHGCISFCLSLSLSLSMSELGFRPSSFIKAWIEFYVGTCTGYQEGERQRKIRMPIILETITHRQWFSERENK